MPVCQNNCWHCKVVIIFWVNLVITYTVYFGSGTGLLSPPPSLHIRYFSDPYYHSLLWNAPFTLDLTNREPDITSYTVCNNLTSNCVTTKQREYTFPNLCDPINFSITAHNVVGKGNASSITYEPRNHESKMSVAS